MVKLKLSFALAVAAISWGCGGSPSVTAPMPTAEFALQVSSQTAFVPIGFNSSNFQISIVPTGGFTQPVSVSMTGVPQGVNTTPSTPFTISPGSSRTLVFNAAAGVTPNLQQISLVATSGILTHTTTVSLSIAQPVYAFIGVDGPINMPLVGGGILEYAIDSNTGSVTPVANGPSVDGNPPTGPVDPAYLATASLPGGTFLFVVTGRGGFSNLSTFKVDPATGSSTQLSSVVFGNPLGINLWGRPVIHPSGRFLYANRDDFTNNQYCVVAFLIDPETANLTESSCSGDPANSLVLPWPGNFAYTTAHSDGTLRGYAVDQNDGSLTPLQNIPAGQMETVLATDPKGRALYDLVASSTPSCSQFRIWTIDSTSGSLTPVNTSFGANQCSSLSISFNPPDTFAYATTSSKDLQNGISVGAVDSVTGKLTELPGSPFSSAWPALVEPSQGKFLFGVVPTSNSVGSYLIDPVTGAPAQTPTSTVSIPPTLDMFPNGTVAIVVASN